MAPGAALLGSMRGDAHARRQDRPEAGCCGSNPVRDGRARKGKLAQSSIDARSATISLYVAHYNLCRVHEAHRTTPAVAVGIADHIWSIGNLLGAVLAINRSEPPRRPPRLTVIQGGMA